MPAYYAPIPSQHDADRELDAAFEADDDDEHTTESTALVPPSREPTSSLPGAYDFEREYAYDYPPPGSPPLSFHPISSPSGTMPNVATIVSLIKAISSLSSSLPSAVASGTKSDKMWDVMISAEGCTISRGPAQAKPKPDCH
ncbi:hypothetical protein H0H87_012108 [Tephrocybe sp. NHM501043]|nr:hypothetical protein H0H87_012108 [Tephrocybe sp. NHM501043]